MGAAAAGVGSVALPLPPLGGRQRSAKPKLAGGLPRRVGALVLSLPDHPWLDRLVRGRAWIPVLGILLAGIVATQVEILKLGAGMGQALEQTTTLANQNEQLRDSVATLGDDQRIERLAGAMGMVLPPPGAVGYLAAGPGGNVAGALANLHSPDPSAFVALTPRDGDGAMVTGPGTSTLPPLPGAPAPPPAVPATGSGATGSGATGSGATGPGVSTSTATATGTAATATGTAATATGTAATATPQTQTTSTQIPDTTGQATSATPAPTPQTDQSSQTSQTSQGPATGAAAIQPAGSDQQSGGG